MFRFYFTGCFGFVIKLYVFYTHEFYFPNFAKIEFRLLLSWENLELLKYY